MFFVAKICKRALRASIEGYLAVAASTPTYSSLVKEKTMEKLLEFIYTKRFSDGASLPELLYAADKYNVTDLVG